MKVTLPLFREGIEWRKTTPEERGDKPWKYILLKDIFIRTKVPVKRRYNCRSGGRIWMKLLAFGIWMLAGYAWNGNTASPDSLLGVWLLLPSLFHDGLFQFSGAAGFPETITLAWANALYFALSPAWIGWAYWSGLFVGSWKFWKRKPAEEDIVEEVMELEPV